MEWVIGLRQPIVERPPSAGEHEVVARDEEEDENWDEEEMRDVSGGRGRFPCTDLRR